MLRIPIRKEDVEWAKKETAKFDEQKTYEKLDCDTNYIGLLGEITFHRWMERSGIIHEWMDFVKQGWDEPDFKMGEIGMDLKTTFDNKGWLQNGKFDIYLFSRVNEDLKELFVLGFLKGKRVEKLIIEEKLEKRMRQGRIDYVVPINKMRPLYELFKNTRIY